MNELLKRIQLISDPHLRRTCDALFDEQFAKAPASLSFHHAYEGGLLAHTLEVTDYALNASPRGTNTDVLITAALWHDFAKIYEYQIVNICPEGTRALRCGSSLWIKIDSLLGDYPHIIDGAIMFAQAATSVSPNVVEQIQHCILAHHGRKEWGSPVEPQTREALLLHHADMLSAKYGETK